MGMKVMGDCFCERCGKPVAAQKSTHRLRNAASTVAFLGVGPVAWGGYAKGRWHCPHCGGPVRDLRKEADVEALRGQMRAVVGAAWRHPIITLAVTAALVVGAIIDAGMS